MKKKILSLIIVFALGAVCLTGCGNTTTPDSNGSNAGTSGNEALSSTDESTGTEVGTATDSTPVEITVEVVHADASTKEFVYTTTEEMLGTVIVEEGLVEGYIGEYGLVIEKVDGEQAIYEEDNAYWSLLINGEYAQTGADSTPVEAGTTYSLVYTPATME